MESRRPRRGGAEAPRGGDQGVVRRVEERVRGAVSGYSDEPIPLGGYAVLVGGFAAVFGGALAAAAASRRLPERVDAADVVLLGVATHKLTRLLTKDWVTAPLRAPFVRYEKSTGAGEVAEKSRGRGLRRAVGDLVTCPWCTGPWVAAALVGSLVARPRATRLVASTFAVVAVSDFLHHAYGRAKKLAD